ncbi:MAG: hypothetical protein ACYS9Y_05105 [Planctomycetota bacterium]|jgi:hypothetical protein
MRLIERLIILSVVATGVFILQSCDTSDDSSADFSKDRSFVTADVKKLHNRPSKIYCPCNNMPGRDLVFDLTVENNAEEAKTVYAFVWVTNDEVSPPERALWPTSAVDSCLTNTGQLNVTDYTAGTKINLKVGDMATLSANSILQPFGYYKGQLLDFHEMRIELWSNTGSRIFEKTVNLR